MGIGVFEAPGGVARGSRIDRSPRAAPATMPLVLDPDHQPHRSRSHRQDRTRRPDQPQLRPLVVDGGGDGSALIRPDGSTQNAGAVAGIGPRAMVGTAPSRPTRPDDPRRAAEPDRPSFGETAGEISFDEVVSDLPPLPAARFGRQPDFRFGGRLGSPAMPTANIAAIFPSPSSICESFDCSRETVQTDRNLIQPLTNPLREAVSGQG